MESSATTLPPWSKPDGTGRRFESALPEYHIEQLEDLLATPSENLLARVQHLQRLCADAEETLRALRQAEALAQQELSDTEWLEGEAAQWCEVHTPEDAKRMFKFTPKTKAS